MTRDLTQNVTVQTKSVTGSGTSRVESWANASTYRAVLTPASTAAVERGTLLGRAITHTILLPRGVTLNPTDHRLTSGSSVYRIAQVVDTPKGVLVNVEVFT